MSVNVRLSEPADIDQIMSIYDIGRQTMRNNGNNVQWVNGYPSKTLIEQDIQQKQSYVITENNVIHAVFAFILGDDHTYSYIEEGEWLYNTPYGTIHRIASDGLIHGALQTATDFGFTKIDHIRIDTHAQNSIMQRAIAKSGYKKCGIIYIDDGTPRVAFEIKK